MTDSAYSLTRGRIAAIGIGAILAVLAAFFAWQANTQAAGTVLVRGVVKSGGAVDHINLYITHVAEAPDPSAIRGTRTDVDVDGAKLYKWIVDGGSLTKVRTTANPVPEKEVVVRGTLKDDGRIGAVWVVQNYREFTVEGTFEGRELDTGYTDQGWATVNVDTSVFRNVTPTKKFKEAALKGKDILFRVNGSTAITALGNAKSFEEVTGSGQKVRIEGALNDENVWVASKFYELNE